jgi:hypothetical protein
MEILMILYLKSQNSGGSPPDEVFPISDSEKLIGYAAKICNMGANIGLDFFYDICGRGSTVSKQASVLKGNKKDGSKRIT